MRHAKAQRQLYEYLQDELPAADRARLEEHLRSCARCARALTGIRDASGLLSRPATLPSDERSDQFWEAFADRVLERIRTASAPSVRGRARIELLRIPWLLYKRAILAGTATVAVAMVLIALWPAREQQPTDASGAAMTESPLDVQTDLRMDHYLRRSKVLLVGLANLKTSVDHPADISVERRASRELAEETRYLKQLPLDRQSARLLNDLDKIFIGLSNIEESRNPQEVEMIRGGIHRQNLLFKVRMAEAMYNQARIVNASGTK